MAENKNEEVTQVTQADVNIDELFALPGAENIIVQGEEEEDEKKPNIFSSTDVDTSFLDNKPQPAKPAAKVEDSNDDDETVSNQNAEETEEALNELDSLISQQEDSSGRGRKKVDKSGLVELASKMIEEGVLFPFDDDKPLDEYSAKDFRELFEANMKEKEAELSQRIPQQIFQSMPGEMQYLMDYISKGGTDLKGMMQQLSQVNEAMELDPSDPNDQEAIIRQYLSIKGDMSQDEIEDEIATFKDMDRLEQKASQYKPKLEAVREKEVARRIAEQEKQKEQQQAIANEFVDSVYGVLEKGEIGGVKLDRKTQNMLYTGLVQPGYPSISGKPTNLLGHLLEKYQWVEPNHELIAEALWLLADPEGFKTKIKSQGNRAATEQTVRSLKTEQARRVGSAVVERESDTATNKSRKTIQRANKNIFKF
jgi:hypothetical protein